MRIMIAIIAIMVFCVLSITIMSPSGAGETGNGNKLQASINEPVQ